MNQSSLKTGINLGGWISQYAVYDTRHFNTFITEPDIQHIADWGMDHVRLPVNYPVLEDDRQPGVYKESGFGYIDNCLKWCQKSGLRLILDLHRAPGFSFTNTLVSGDLSQNTLFTDHGTQERFISLWEAITRRYLGQAEDDLAFELLNEMVLPDSMPWNLLAQKTIDRIRLIDPDRLIIIGGNNYNAVNELVNIDVAADPQLLYTFHCYEPMVVTHQKAPWVEALYHFNQATEYPGICHGLGEFLEAHPKFKTQYGPFVDKNLDKDLLRDILYPAFNFSEKTGHRVYCGEFGVIDRASLETRINWTGDFVELLKELDIGYAIWTYKEMDFGLVDLDGNIVSDELVKATIQ
jgi:endoglucanase